MKRAIKWNIKTLSNVIKATITPENKFDFVLFIDGKRGTSKSTLAYKTCCWVSRKFNPWKDIVYSREDMINQIAKKKYDVIFADELINVAYRRDFYLEDQKTLIKMLNMYRDSCNFIVGCIPSFVTLDRDLQKMVKMRITMIRRGLGVVQLPNHAIYSSDPWDVDTNRKIEAKWNPSKPKYQQLTTFAGYIVFTDITPTQRKICEEVKNEKRARLMDIDGTANVLDPMERLLERIKQGKISFEMLKEYAIINGFDYERLKVKLNLKLREEYNSKLKSEDNLTPNSEEKPELIRKTLKNLLIDTKKIAKEKVIETHRLPPISISDTSQDKFQEPLKKEGEDD